MATSLLRIGRLTQAKCLHAVSWTTLSRTPAAGAFSTKSGGSKKSNTKKTNTAKKQPKTYFDVEKLIQHKSYEFPKKEVSSAVTAAAAVNTTVGATPIPESKPNAGVVETVATISDMKTPASVLEATNAVNESVLAAEAISASKSDSETAVAGEVTSEAEVIATFQPIQSSEPAVEVAPVAEAMPLIEAVTKVAAVVEDVGGPSVETATSTTDITASEGFAEAVPEPLQEATPFEDVPKSIVEPALREGLESMEEAASLEMAPKPKTKVAPTEAISEMMDKSASVDVAPELVAEAVPVKPIFESMAEAAPQPVVEASPAEVCLEPVAEAASPEAVSEPVVEASPVDLTLKPVVEVAMDSGVKAASLEGTPESMGEAAPVTAVPEPLAEASEATDEVSATKESFKEMVDPVPVLAEAAGEELQMEAAAESVEPSEAQMDPIQKLFLDSIRHYSAKSQAAGGPVDASSEYEKNLAQEIAKLQRLYGGGDLTSFPEFKFTEPKLDEVSSK